MQRGGIMKKSISSSKKLFVLLILFLAIFLKTENVFAATTVTDFNGLKNAIETGTDDEINVQGNINVTETLKVNRDVKISGGGVETSKLSALGSIENILKVENGKKLTIENITLDGNKQARLIYSNGGILKITNSNLKNGCPGNNATANPGGGILLKGGSLTATNSDFKGNTPGTTQGLGAGDGDVNGGAIYSGNTPADITITGGSFENNEVKAYGHGAAIYQENGKLIVDGTSFKNNKGHVEGGNAGTQGVCIHTRDKVTATISNVNAEIAKGFNTGGFLRSLGSDVTVTKSTFTIAGLGDGYGYSGGAFCFENGKSNVTGSTFTCTGSKLFHAGGFIDIVGSGTHVIDNNTMTGAGNDNNSAIASFGGAISVEQGATATVTIKDNTITKSTASDNGGAIATGTYLETKIPKTKPGEPPIPKDTTAIVTMSGNKISNSGLIMWKGGAGGAIFVGKGARVTASGDQIKDTKAPYGGGVYNEGTLTINGGASLTGGIALSLGGEIYNNGELTVDDATITGNFVGGAWWNGNPHPSKPNEYGGVNIYAEKDVTITPNATIATDKDVRVLDGQSKILLTGALTKEIDVSVSEVAGGNEKAKRRVGYVVAQGTNGYTVTKSDAKFLHYIGKNKKNDDGSLDMSHYTNQHRAAYDDHTSTGTWDFVLDKDNKQVVLGQRVKLIYHGNLGKFGTKDSEEKLVDVYKSGNFWEGQLEEYKVADPTRDKYSFMAWYFWKDGDSAEDTENSIQNIKKPDGFTNDLFDFSKVTFQNNVADTDKIITPNIINTYAGWSENVSIPVLKEWIDTEEADKTDVTVTLKGGVEDKSVTLTNANQYNDIFDDLPVFTKSYEGEEKNMNLRFEPKTYSVVETPIAGFTTSYSPQSMIANQVAEISRFVVTNKKTFKVTYEFKSEDSSKTLPKGVTDQLPKEEIDKENGATVKPSKSSFTDVTDGDGTWSFKSWDENSKTINKSDVTFIGTWTFAKIPGTKYKVTYEFKPEDASKTLPEAVTNQKPADQTGVANGTKITPATFTDVTDGEDTWTFKGWDPTEQTINKADIHFVGTWTLAAKPQPKTGSVYVKYVDEKGTGIAEKTELKKAAPVGEEYSATPKTIEGYEYLKLDDNSAPEKGTVAEGEKTVVYVYKKTTPQPKTGSVYVKYITEDGKVLEEEKYVLENAEVGKKYTTEQKKFKGYEFSKMAEYSAAAEGEVIEVDLHVVYVYKKVEEQPPVEKVITKYVDENGINIIPPKEGDHPKKDFTGYEFVETTVSKTDNSKTITHHYKKIEGKIPPIDFSNIIIFKKSEPVSDDSLLNKYDHKAYMFGYPDWTFRPERNMTRAEATAMFARLLKNYPKTYVKYNLPYRDVFEDDWYYLAVGFMTEKNIITGYEDGTFRPNSPITRAEFATMASKFDSLAKGGGKSFVDVDESHWAFMYINSAFKRGWVTGYEDGTFKPDRNISRAEVVTITNKMLDRYCDKEFVINHRDLLIKFTDLDESYWAYFNIMEATHGHDYTRRGNGIDEWWHRLNGEEFRFVVVGRK